MEKFFIKTMYIDLKKRLDTGTGILRVNGAPCEFTTLEETREAAAEFMKVYPQFFAEAMTEREAKNLNLIPQ